MRIRLFSGEDFASVLEVQRAAKHASKWGPADYQRLAADPDGLILVVEEEDATPAKLAGFAAFHCIGEEAELWNLAVAPEFQRQGIAKTLLRDAFRKLGALGVKRVFLEVRASNAPALGLYRTVGSKIHSRRKGYYQNPREDAVVLRLELESRCF